MNILVTGGAGYIGSHFCRVAHLAGLTPVVLDNLSTGHQSFVKFGPFVHADIRDTYQVEKALRDHDIQAVVHFAAKSLVGESMTRPDHYYSNNVVGTISLLRAMKSANVRTIVFSSSAAVYGIAKSDTITETHSLEPISPYGRSKLMCEQIIQDCEMAHGIRYAFLRYFNVVGESPDNDLWENHNPETHLLPNLVKALRENRAFELFGTKFATPDGTAIRDYVDVNDLGQAHLMALKVLNQQKKLISNIGMGRGYSVREVFNTLGKVFGKTPECIEKPPRIGDPPKLVADSKFFNSWCNLKMRSLEESLHIMKINSEKGRS